MIEFLLNGKVIRSEASPGEVVLDVVRRDVGLKGTKEGCREGDCGACMVLLGTPGERGVEYYAINSCLLPVGTVAGKHVVSIEGLNGPGLTPVQQAIVDEGATQCGFCTPGFVIALTGFLLGDMPLDPDSGYTAVSGNMCRCTGYLSIRRVVKKLCAAFAGTGNSPAARLEAMISSGVVPAYFETVPRLLAGMSGETPVCGVAGPPGDALPRQELDAGSSPPPEMDDTGGQADPGNAILIAGGTDLIVQRPEEVSEARLVLLERREDLRGIRIEAKDCWIGAATPVEEITRSEMLQELFPGTDPHIELISSVAIRHRATVGGNLVNASPIGDMAILLLALNVDVILCAGEQRRSVPLKEFFTGYKQLNREPDELVEAVRFKRPSGGSLFNFEKVSRRKHLDIASVNSAMMITVEHDVVRDVHMSAGGVAPIPFYLASAAESLRGQTLSAESIRRAADEACSAIAPISDVRGSGEYKRVLLGRLVRAHFIELFPGRFGEELLS
ncbi:MAG: FAD binding domain-containing protein [Kiritimatiellia bacterium]|nr:FAD binding domain-containing protein [Kiritimatiellia bacterium]MDP6631769.1 FAD binding domain-containing protein [Kiritimatiellia bacterium]MDP6810477.1 FAD binding domain-containing protein [Kiritimatiellia bacterium]MDP7025005.1 FAD binding domain-containing protein [Kiritimatiellia bacterium]